MCHGISVHVHYDYRKSIYVQYILMSTWSLHGAYGVNDMHAVHVRSQAVAVFAKRVRALPTMASARLQRWALLLSAYL
jgi:hypothetical protein